MSVRVDVVPMQDDALVLLNDADTTVFVGKHLTLPQQMVAAAWLATDLRDPAVEAVRWPRGQLEAVAHVIADGHIAELLLGGDESIRAVEDVIYALCGAEPAA